MLEFQNNLAKFQNSRIYRDQLTIFNSFYLPFNLDTQKQSFKINAEFLKKKKGIESLPQTLISKSDDIFGTQLGFNNALAIDIDRKLATIKYINYITID